MDKVREEFEAWIVGLLGCDDADITKDSSGVYESYQTGNLYVAWIASRAALCVELPEVRVLDGGRIAEIGYELAIDDFERSLDAAGVRYK